MKKQVYFYLKGPQKESILLQTQISYTLATKLCWRDFTQMLSGVIDYTLDFRELWCNINKQNKKRIHKTYGQIAQFFSLPSIFFSLGVKAEGILCK